MNIGVRGESLIDVSSYGTFTLGILDCRAEDSATILKAEYSQEKFQHEARWRCIATGAPCNLLRGILSFNFNSASVTVIRRVILVKMSFTLPMTHSGNESVLTWNTPH